MELPADLGRAPVEYAPLERSDSRGPLLEVAPELKPSEMPPIFDFGPRSMPIKGVLLLPDFRADVVPDNLRLDCGREE